MKLDKDILMDIVKEVIEENTNGVYKYASTQIQMDEEIAEDVIAFGMEIPDEFVYNDPEDPSLGREDDIHCTVLYGLESDDPTPVRDLLHDYPPFTVILGPISYFEAEDYDVMKIEVISDQLHEMNRSLDELDNANTFPDYNPHVTIAYVTKDFDRESIDPLTFDGMTSEITEVIMSTTTKTRIPIALF